MREFFQEIRYKFTFNKICLLVLLIVYSVSVIILSNLHEFWMDELHVWDMDLNLNLWQLIEKMSEEGHFITWHLLVMPFAKSGANCTFSLPLISSTFMVAAAWILIYKSDFSFLSKICILFYVPSLYYFPVICRVYALIPLTLYLIALVYPKREIEPLKYGILLGILINTHLYMEGFGLALLFCWGYEILALRPRKRPKIEFFSWCTSFFLGILAFLQVAGNFFQESTPAFSMTSSLSSLSYEFMDRYLSFIHIFITHSVPSSLHPALYILLAILFLCWYCYIMRNFKKELLIIIIGIVYQILFALFIYYCHDQMFYLPFYMIIFGFWATRLAKTKYCTHFITFIMTINLYYSYSIIRHDIEQPFEMFETIWNIYKDDKNTLKIKDNSHPISLIESCYGHDQNATEVNIDSEHDIYSLIDSLKPLSFTIYGTQSPYDKYNYDSIEDSLIIYGYSVNRTKISFKRLNARANILKCDRTKMEITTEISPIAP